MRKQMMSDGEGLFAFLCDFDGTVCPTQMMDFLYQRFAACGMEFAERWGRGEISTQEEIVSTFETVSASREEMEAALDTIEIDPHFPAFLQFCRNHNYSFAILSDGLEWYIDYILRGHGFPDIMIYANNIYFEEDGFRFSFPWHKPENPLRATSKPAIVRKYQEQGFTVAFIGDGKSDFDIVGVADVIYARGHLAEYCQSENISAISFIDFQDLLVKWKDL